jgi:hypothetical protein
MENETTLGSALWGLISIWLIWGGLIALIVWYFGWFGLLKVIAFLWIAMILLLGPFWVYGMIRRASGKDRD